MHPWEIAGSIVIVLAAATLVTVMAVATLRLSAVEQRLQLILGAIVVPIFIVLSWVPHFDASEHGMILYLIGQGIGLIAVSAGLLVLWAVVGALAMLGRWLVMQFINRRASSPAKRLRPRLSMVHRP